MSDRASAANELRTARLSLRRPAEADIDSIFAIHHDPETCLHNPSDALATFEEAESLYQRWDEQWRRCGWGYWVVRRRGFNSQLGFARQIRSIASLALKPSNAVPVATSSARRTDRRERTCRTRMSPALTASRYSRDSRAWLHANASSQPGAVPG